MEIKKLDTILATTGQGLYNLPEDVYHNHKTLGITKSHLDLIHKAPIYYKYHILDGHRRAPTPQMLFGKHLHELVLTPEIFHKKYYFFNDTKINKRTKAGKEEMQKYAENSVGKELIDWKEYLMLTSMDLSLKRHLVWQSFSEFGISEITALWTNDKNIKCRARIDLLCNNFIIDLKTTSSLKDIEKSIYQYRYHCQAAFYTQAIRQITAKTILEPIGFIFVFIEKTPPYVIRTISLDVDGIAIAEKELSLDMLTYQKCVTDNQWPGYMEKIETISLPRWAIEQDF